MADALTATPDPQFAQVTLKVSYTNTAAFTATVERSDDGGVTWTAVRGSPVTLVGPVGAGDRIAYLTDTEMPLDTAVRYRSTSNLGLVLTAGPVTVVEGGASWLKDPARPWANIRLTDCTFNLGTPGCPPAATEPAVSLVGAGLGTESYAADAGLFPILGSPRPADVYARRKDAVTSWRVVSHTCASKLTLDAFYTAGGPIFLQLNPVYCWPDRYYQPGQVDVSRLTQDLTDPRRYWDVPLAAMNAPVGAAQGTCENNWCIIDSTYATYANLTASGFTWGDVMAGNAATC
jgi:hypothetical protein